MNSKTTLVIGAQWGDEGKGKLVDILGETHQIIVRSGGGANAGHTIVRNGTKYIFHLLPSGLLTEGNIGVIGNGCVVDPIQLCKEITNLEDQGLSLENRVYISDRAHVLFEYHQKIDEIQEEQRGENGIGTTKRGIGPCYADKIARQGIRMSELKNLETLKKKLERVQSRLTSAYNLAINPSEIIEKLRTVSQRLSPYILDTSEYLENARKEGKNIVIEGAQAFALDIDFGTYPFVTSSSITTGGMSTGCGISARNIDEVIGVLKAYCSRVGEGPFPSELDGEQEEYLREKGGEYGATTGRPRRCGWLDLVMLKSFIRVNAPDCWNITKLDVLDSFDQIGIVTGYLLDGKEISSFPAESDNIEKIEPIIQYFPGWKTDISATRSRNELPENAQAYIRFIEEQTGVPAKYIGVGAGNEALLKG